MEADNQLTSIATYNLQVDIIIIINVYSETLLIQTQLKRTLKSPDTTTPI